MGGERGGGDGGRTGRLGWGLEGWRERIEKGGEEGVRMGKVRGGRHVEWGEMCGGKRGMLLEYGKVRYIW
jgi:hypothetical protein